MYFDINTQADSVLSETEKGEIVPLGCFLSTKNDKSCMIWSLHTIGSSTGSGFLLCG